MNYNQQQKKDRLLREIAHFEARVASLGVPQTPQQKRAKTLAQNTLRNRQRLLASFIERVGP